MLGEIARMAAQGLGTLGDEVLLLLFDLSESERVLMCWLRAGGVAVEDMDDDGGVALGGPTLRVNGHKGVAGLMCA